MYTTQDAIEIAQKLEPVFAAINLHIAIGGSCVYRGHSEKDIDVFIYPHSRQTSIDRSHIASVLLNEGYLARTPDNEATKIADVYVTKCERTGRRVDFFFLERHNLLNPADEKVTPSDLIK